MLTIEDYNQKEIDGRIQLSNRFIRTFKPKAFNNGGFPTTVEKEQELIRYIDSMHAYSFERHFHDLCNGITKEEFDLVKKATIDIFEATKELYDGHFLVKAPMMASVCEKRILESTTDDIKGKRVLEIGGGSGTLGCLLLEDGYNYASTDVTQAFYLIQNRLFERISKTGVNELVTQDLDRSSHCIHIPYWKLWEMRNEPIEFDIAMSNHALLEMNPSSLKFYLNLCRKAMEKSKEGVFVFQGGGWRIDQNLIDLIELFDEYGFYLKYLDHSKEIAGFSLKEGSVKEEAIEALKGLLREGVETEKIYALGSTIRSHLDPDQVFYCDELGNRMKNHFQEIENQPKIKIEELIEFYQGLNTTEETPDDEFAEYIRPKVKTL